MVGLGCSLGFRGFEFTHVRTHFSMVGLGQPIFVVGLGCSPGFLGFEFAHVRTCFSVVGLGQPIFAVGLGCSLGFLGFEFTHVRTHFPVVGLGPKTNEIPFWLVGESVHHPFESGIFPWLDWDFTVLDAILVGR